MSVCWESSLNSTGDSSEKKTKHVLFVNVFRENDKMLQYENPDASTSIGSTNVVQTIIKKFENL